ncbi:MAG: hypothetical protein U5L75_01605 [Candidatus Campbellbacteria bacterium]|nr:hypothetical protein [Candidatus Campbellbacteria bacterium]
MAYERVFIGYPVTESSDFRNEKIEIVGEKDKSVITAIHCHLLFADRKRMPVFPFFSCFTPQLVEIAEQTEETQRFLASPFKFFREEVDLLCLYGEKGIVPIMRHWMGIAVELKIPIIAASPSTL